MKTMVLAIKLLGIFYWTQTQRHMCIQRDYPSNNFVACGLLSFLVKEVIKLKVKEVGDSGSQRLIINKNVTPVQRTG